MRVCAVSLQCIVLALLFIDDIIYNDVPVSNREDHDSFAPVVLMVVMPNCVLLLDDCHSSSRGAYDGEVECGCIK